MSPTSCYFVQLLLLLLCCLVSHAASQSPFDEVGKIIEEYEEIQHGFLVVGNASGIVYQYQKGTDVEYNTTLEIMSSSKWMAGVTIMKLVERGLLSLDDPASKYLPFWTRDPSDLRSKVTLQHLLSFTSGFANQLQDPACISQNMELYDCAEICYNEGNFTFVPGETFQYGSIHLQFAGAIAEMASGKRYQQLFSETILEPMGMKETYFNPASGNNPALAFGLSSTTSDYEKFLRGYFLDELLATEIRQLMELDYTPNRQAMVLPGYHYSLTNWFECNMFRWNNRCLEENVHGSVGAYGFYPVVDRKLQYYFAWGTNYGYPGGTTASAVLRHQFKPVLDEIMAP